MGLDVEFFMNLIEAVKGEPILYVKSYPGYSSKNNRVNAWKRISQKIEEPQDVCEKRWSLLREKFARKLKKMNTPSGSGVSFQQEWPFFDPMSFLIPHIKTRGIKSKESQSDKSEFLLSTETSIKSKKEDESSSDTTSFLKSYLRPTKSDENKFDEPASPVSSPDDPLLPIPIVSTETPIKKRKKDILTTELKSLIDLYKKSLKESDDSIFMKSMAILMKDLPEASKNKIRRKTFDAIMEEKEKFL